MRRIVLALVLGSGWFGVLAAASVRTPSFGYDRTAALELQTLATVRSDGIETRDVTFAAGHQRVTAALVTPLDGKRHAGILFVHWLGDPKTTNHREFLAQARELGRHGATTLLVDAMWAKPNWFETRTTSGDYRASIAQVVQLRRALDVLLAQSDVDTNRIAYVGHDFGAMYGALVAGVDVRPRYYVFMTPTSTLWEWYLLGSRPADKYGYIDQMRLLDPARYLIHATMRATLLQFGERDAYVPEAAAHEFAAAVPNRGRTVKEYACDHDMALAAATRDRRAWLIVHLSLY